MADSTGSSTVAAAVPATAQGPAPHIAAPQVAPVDNVPLAESKRKQKNFAPRKAIPDMPAAKSGGISQMLAGVADLPFNSVKRNQVTYKVPCFVMFYYVVSLMNNQMTNTKRFYDANPDWHPFVSYLYFAILIFYHVLKCQQQGATISQEQMLFLEFIEENYSVRNAKIPGPLVPFFQALAANAGPDANYGNVVFGIPNNLGVTQADHFQFENLLDRVLPNIIFVLDQFMRIIADLAPIAPANAAPVAVNMSMADRVFMNIYGTNAANAAANRTSMLNPCGLFEPQTTTQLLSGFIGASPMWRSCLPFDPATGRSTYTTGNNGFTLGFDQVLGFRGFGNTATVTFDWFSQVGRIMQPYADFFRDSVSLGSVSTTGIGVNYITTTYTATATPVLAREVVVRDIRYQPAGSNRYDVVRFANIYSYQHHSEEYLEEVTEQMGMLTQLDVVWNEVNADANAVHPGPARADVAVGPLEQRLVMRTTRANNVPSTLPDIISGYYHTPAALKFE